MNFKKIGYEITDSGVTFESDIELEFTFIFYTDYMLTELFLTEPVKTYTEQTYLQLITAKSFNPTAWVLAFGPILGPIFFAQAANQITRNLHYTYSNYTFGEVAAKGYSTGMNFDFSFVNFKEEYLKAEGLNISEFKINKIRPYVTSVSEIITKTSTSLNTYKDIFLDRSNPAYIDVHDLRAEAVTADMGGQGQSALVSAMRSVNNGIGVKQSGITNVSLTPGSVRQVKSGPLKKDTIVNNRFTLDLIRNMPDITLYQNSITASHAQVVLDTEDYNLCLGTCINIDPAGIVRSNSFNTTLNRFVGYRGDNYAQEVTFVAKMKLFSDVEIDSAEDKKILLRIPEFYQGDVVWDISLFSETGSVTFTSSTLDIGAWFNLIKEGLYQIIIIVALVAALYIGIRTLPKWTGAIVKRINRK